MQQSSAGPVRRTEPPLTGPTIDARLSSAPDTPPELSFPLMKGLGVHGNRISRLLAQDRHQPY